MAYTVAVDLNRCQGYAYCVMTASTVFDLDDDLGKAIVMTPNPGDSLRDLCEKALRGCPTQAISIDES